MKKLMSLLNVFLIVLLLSSCKKILIENEAPIIHGSETLVLEVFSEAPDWKQFITADDTEDGSIPILDNMITVDNVDLDTLGTYNVEYNVVDSMDETTQFILSVSVVDSIAPTANIDTVIVAKGSAPIDWTTYDLEFQDNYSDVITAEVVSNNIDYNVVNDYQVTLELSDEFDNSREIFVIVKVQLLYASGIYDLSTLPGSEKGIIIADLENYLLQNVYGGVPLYTSATRTIFSPRVQLYNSQHNIVFGFGEAYSEFTDDDSSVLMYGDTYGNVDEYTWRTSFNNDPSTLNPWLSDTGSTDMFLDHINGSLYEFYYAETETGYDIIPSLASSNPIPVDPEMINGKTYSTIWQIEVRDDLEWAFHQDLDTSSFTTGYETLDASDYLWTWEHAISEEWFRAVSGGGDFKTFGIKNIDEFIDGSTTFDNVGLRLADGETNVIELEFDAGKSAYEIMYMFTNSKLAPINKELFESAGSNYATEALYIASSGVYLLDEWILGQQLSFIKNSTHPDSTMYHYTGVQYRYMDDSEEIFNEFLAGRLDSAPIPTDRIIEYISNSQVYATPDASIWSLNINAFGTIEARDTYIAEHPNVPLDETFVPEPILSYLEMRQALYYGFDRYHAAVDVVQTYLPVFTCFPSNYFIDAESGLTTRGTYAGAQILNNFGGTSNAFFPDAATNLFNVALTKAIADGYYTAGTAEIPTIIELQLEYASNGNATVQAMVAEIERQYELLLYDPVYHVGIDIVVHDNPHPDQYYDYMMIANTDLGLGAISAYIYSQSSLLERFTDNNSTGLTLNWGIDTHSALIPVTYRDSDRKKVSRIWSYDTLVAALQGEVYVFFDTEGVEQTTQGIED